MDEGVPQVRTSVLRQRLRQETMALHAELDTVLAFPPRCDFTWYQRFLTVNAAVIGVEQELARAGIQELLPDWPDRARGAALENDFETLGLRPPPRNLVSIGSDPAILLGWAYVLEGSRLGARVVLKFVEATAPPKIRAATRFLRHGHDQGFWLSFLAILQHSNLDDAATARACKAARRAFSCFLDFADLDHPVT
jgi:heme oxygenase